MNRTLTAASAAGILLLGACASLPEEEEIAQRLALGRESLAEGEAAEAAPHFEYVVALRPRMKEGYQGLGASYEKLGRDAEAIRIYDNGLRLGDPKDEVCLRGLGRLQARRGMHEAAIRTYRRLEEVVPGDETVRAEIARLEREQGDVDARAERDRLERARKRYEEVRGLASKFIDAKRLEEALSALDSYPDEFRDTIWWVTELKPLRERVWKALQDR